MNLKRSILLTATHLAAVILVSTQAFAGAVVVTTTYNDSATTTGEWTGPNSATTTVAATVKAGEMCKAADGGMCFSAVIDKAWAFSYAATILLPTLNAVFEQHTFDATFRATTKTHEDWHDSYARALLASTYGALITWSENYQSNYFQTQAQAIAAGTADLANALVTARNAFQADFATDTTNPAFGHQNAVAVKVTLLNGDKVWRSQNENWGAAAVKHAEGIKVTFTKTAGNCVCVPEPGSAVIFSIGAMGFGAAHNLKRRRSSSVSVG